MKGMQSNLSVMDKNIPDWTSEGPRDDWVLLQSKVVGHERTVVESNGTRFAQNVSARGHWRTDECAQNVVRRKKKHIHTRISLQRRNPIVDCLVGLVAETDFQNIQFLLGEFAEISSLDYSRVQHVFGIFVAFEPPFLRSVPLIVHVDLLRLRGTMKRNSLVLSFTLSRGSFFGTAAAANPSMDPGPAMSDTFSESDGITTFLMEATRKDEPPSSSGGWWLFGK
jgi:hypothetical protein